MTIFYRSKRGRAPYSARGMRPRGHGVPLREAREVPARDRRLTYFRAALWALHHWDIPCPCGAWEAPARDRRSTYFLAALSALHHLDIPCPCNAREHPLGRGGRTKSDKNGDFPLSQSGFPSRSFSPQLSPPFPVFLVAAWDLPYGWFGAVVLVGRSL